MCESGCESVDRTIPFGVYSGNWSKTHATTAAIDVVHENPCMILLLTELDVEPIGYAAEAFCLEIHAHGEV